MGPDRLNAAMAAVRQEFAVEIADTPETQAEAFRLRYQVYCLERKFEPGLDGLETDAYDAMSHHLLLRHIASQEAIGTVRLIRPRLRGPHSELPMEQLSSLLKLRQLPRERVAEVSRFALSKSRRVASGCMGHLLRLALIRGIVQLSGDLKLSHWCALMEPKLLRLLQTSSIYFHQVGGLLEHHGFRQPSYVALGAMLDRVRMEQPAVWEFLTDNGTLWREDSRQRSRQDIAA